MPFLSETLAQNMDEMYYMVRAHIIWEYTVNAWI